MTINDYTLQFIGTSDGVTSVDRFHSSIMLGCCGRNLLVDAGDGVSKALLMKNIKFNSVSAVIISHFHADHAAGIPSLITQMKLSGREEPLDIYVYDEDLDKIKTILEYSYLEPEEPGFDINYRVFNDGEELDIFDDLSLIPAKNTHLEKFESGKKGELSYAAFSFLFNLHNHKIHYTSDIGNADDIYLFKDSEPEVLICETAHIEWEDIMKAFDEVNPEKLYLTHIPDEISDMLQGKINTLSEAKAEMVTLAADGMLIRFNGNGIEQ